MEHKNYTSWSVATLKHLKTMMECVEPLDIDDYDKEHIVCYQVNLAQGFALRNAEMQSFVLRFQLEIAHHYNHIGESPPWQGACEDYLRYRRDNVSEQFDDSEELLHSLIDGFEKWYLYTLRNTKLFVPMDNRVREYILESLSDI